jgi:formyl-CoA transferase
MAPPAPLWKWTIPSAANLSVGNPIKLSDSPTDAKRSPLPGEHTDEILRQVLGSSDRQVAEIHDSGALDPPR